MVSGDSRFKHQCGDGAIIQRRFHSRPMPEAARDACISPISSVPRWSQQSMPSPARKQAAFHSSRAPAGSVRSSLDLLALAKRMRDEERSIPRHVSLLVAANALQRHPEDLRAKLEVRPACARSCGTSAANGRPMRRGMLAQTPAAGQSGTRAQPSHAYSHRWIPAQAGAEAVVTQPPLLWPRFQRFLDTWAATPGSGSRALLVGAPAWTSEATRCLTSGRRGSAERPGWEALCCRSTADLESASVPRSRAHRVS